MVVFERCYLSRHRGKGNHVGRAAQADGMEGEMAQRWEPLGMFEEPEECTSHTWPQIILTKTLRIL